jgi:hypothetical protein
MSLFFRFFFPLNQGIIPPILGQIDQIGYTDQGALEISMQSFSAHDAKAHFGKLLDTACREPVTIENTDARLPS